MYKLLIVDDEPHIREGLEDLIDWESLGFFVCGTAVNGKDGLEKIMALEPDACLIDIRMPGLTGIEVIRRAKEKNSQCQFVILTSYSDFDYAKESIGLGVLDYLLKPVDEEELALSMAKVRTALNHQSGYKDYRSDITLKKMLTGKVDDLGQSFHNAHYQVAVFSDNPAEAKILEGVKPFGEDLLVAKQHRETILIFKNTDKVALEQNLGRLASKWQVPMALSRGDLRIGEVGMAYEKGKTLLQRVFSFNEYLLREPVPKNMRKLLREPNLQDIYVGIEFDNSALKEQAMTDLAQYYKETHYSVERIKGDLANLQTALLEKFKNQYPNLPSPKKEGMLNEVYQAQSLQQVLFYLKKEWDKMSLEIQKGAGLEDSIVKRIEHYVQKYYYEELNLQVVGDMFNYNPTYLGKKFKEEVGKSFPKFVDHVRIENAKRLLREQKIKVYEVSDKVGYCNIDYFYRKFKSHVGQSPKEFQKESSIAGEVEE